MLLWTLRLPEFGSQPLIGGFILFKKMKLNRDNGCQITDYTNYEQYTVLTFQDPAVGKVCAVLFPTLWTHCGH